MSYETDENTNVTYSFNKKTGVLTISGKGDMPADMKFRGDSKIKKVVVKKGVTSICDYAFLGCSNLKTVSLPDGLLSIGVKSFENTNIKKIAIPSSVRRIGQRALWGCKRLKWITMPGDFEFVYEEKEPDEWMFRIVSDHEIGGAAPKKITFTTPLKIENVSALSAKYLVVSKDDPLYSSIGGVIYSKDGKALVRIPSERTSFRVPDGVEKIYINAFHYSWYMSDDADHFCSRLKKLYLPKGKCRIIERMNDDEGLNIDEQVLQVIADGTELSGRDIELLARYGFNQYNEKYKNDPAGWFLTGFKGLVKLLDNGCLITNDGLVLRYFGSGGEVVLDSSVKGIGYYAFNYYGVPRQYDIERPGQITSINIPDSVSYIGEYAFYDQYSLERLTIPASVTEFGKYAVANSGIKKIVFEAGIEEIPYGICTDCRSLETVVLPESLKKIGVSAFSDCFSFDIDQYSGFETLPNLTEIGSGAFYNCKMKKFVIPERITKIGSGAFCLNGDYGRDPEEAEIIVMGDAGGYGDRFCLGKAIPVFMKGLDGIKLGITIRAYSTEPDKTGRMLIGGEWMNVGGIDGYEYEASVNEDFSGSAKKETKDSQASAYVNAGSAKVTKLYARVRAYKVDGDGQREYTEWSTVEMTLN
ncbi:MAG: leucine-rich repeat domain-containing protein [Lachnospiraceae bacterium]|nr:leucine-rich repeat domain-containing protein [Lachnospiraceae bacterium]